MFTVTDHRALNLASNDLMGEQINRILVVDDDPKLIHLVKATLNPGFICEGAESAETALKMIEQDGPFDILLCDIMMGEMSGLDLLKHVKRNHSSISTIIMSGSHTVENVISALRARADDYLNKPFNLNDLYESIQTAMQLRLHPLASQEEVKEHGWNTASRALAMALLTKDHETDGHACRVTRFSLRLGREMNLSKTDMLALKLGSRLHDVGKIGIPDSILRKPASLTQEERLTMRAHPHIGQDLLRRLELPEGAARVVGQHHEWWNGSGYPSNLAGEDIDLPARIFSVIDAFDAMISDRVYRRGRPYEDAALELQLHAGTQFDPEVVAAFMRVPKDDWEELRRVCHTDDHSLATL